MRVGLTLGSRLWRGGVAAKYTSFLYTAGQETTGVTGPGVSVSGFLSNHDLSLIWGFGICVGVVGKYWRREPTREPETEKVDDGVVL